MPAIYGATIKHETRNMKHALRGPRGIKSKSGTSLRNAACYSSRGRGVSLVEVVIGTALILASLAGLMTAYSFYLKAGLRAVPSLQAAFLLEEGMEAALLIRDDGWSGINSLTAGTPYFLEWSGGAWRASATPTLVDGAFRRTLVFLPVYRRNSDKDIVASTSPDAKTLDANTRQLTVEVQGRGADVRAVTYLANLFE